MRLYQNNNCTEPPKDRLGNAAGKVHILMSKSHKQKGLGEGAPEEENMVQTLGSD